MIEMIGDTMIDRRDQPQSGHPRMRRKTKENLNKL